MTCQKISRKFNISAWMLTLICYIIFRFEIWMRRVPFKSQSMNLVYKTPEGAELWLGDYYAATNLKLLKQRNIKSGTIFDI